MSFGTQISSLDRISSLVSVRGNGMFFLYNNSVISNVHQFEHGSLSAWMDPWHYPSHWWSLVPINTTYQQSSSWKLHRFFMNSNLIWHNRHSFYVPPWHTSLTPSMTPVFVEPACAILSWPLQPVDTFTPPFLWVMPNIYSHESGKFRFCPSKLQACCT